MAKNNKYASINFNHIYEKTTTTNPHNKNNHHHHHPSPSSSSASYSAVSAPNKPHGRILVLTRPTPKPVTPHTPQPAPNPIHHNTEPRSEPGSDAISLRPLGRTGTASSSLASVPVVAVSNHDKDLPSPQPPKTDKFVPPHLRPGFVPREDTLGPELGRPNGRPKSGGGQERMRRVGPSDAGILGRGSRPNSSG